MKPTLSFLLTSLCLLAGGWLTAQITISGYFTDAESSEPLLAANVIELNTGQGTTSNSFGFYSFTPSVDTARLRFSYVGYHDLDTTIVLVSEDIKLNIQLQNSASLATIVVSSDQGERIEEQTQMSRVAIPVAQIKRIPALLGEVDVLKTLQLLPGIQGGGEGASGLYVRGGSQGQNLVLLDGVPLYNVSHALGIFSVFNADALRNVTLTKGAFPARYGGRLSSVLEITMKEGNLKKWEGEGSLGLISSKLSLSGPIVKDKTSILVSARRTYADLLIGLLPEENRPGEEGNSGLFHFYDINAKLQHKVNDRHRLFLSFYAGEDVFSSEVTDEVGTYGGGTDWGNIVSALRWNWEINSRLFLNTTATYSRYNIDISNVSQNTDGRFESLYRSGIYDLGGKLDFSYIPNPNHYIRFGGGLTNHTYSPGALALETRLEVFPTPIQDTFGSTTIYTNEYFAYLEDDFKIGALKINAGLHFSGLSVGDQQYTSLQPRLGLRYLLSNKVALKLGFATMQQYVNLLTSETLSLPTDLWVPSTENILPQESWQIGGGIARTIREKYEFTLEGFYKEMRNVVSYKEGSSFLSGLDENFEDKVTQGDGQSYGAELLVQRKAGRLTGWLGYTLSWNWRQFNEINGGNRFPFRYDRRHDLSLVANYDLSDKITLSGVFVYGTGSAISVPTYAYSTSIRDQTRNTNAVPRRVFTVENGVEKNGFRMSDYHRLDLSVSFEKDKKWGRRTWVIGVYNAYWHRNPYYLTTREESVCEGGDCQTRTVLREVSILPIIPSVNYKFEF